MMSKVQCQRGQVEGRGVGTRVVSRRRTHNVAIWAVDPHAERMQQAGRAEPEQFWPSRAEPEPRRLPQAGWEEAVRKAVQSQATASSTQARATGGMVSPASSPQHSSHTLVYTQAWAREGGARGGATHGGRVGGRARKEAALSALPGRRAGSPGPSPGRLERCTRQPPMHSQRGAPRQSSSRTRPAPQAPAARAPAAGPPRAAGADAPQTTPQRPPPHTAAGAAVQSRLRGATKGGVRGGGCVRDAGREPTEAADEHGQATGHCQPRHRTSPQSATTSQQHRILAPPFPALLVHTLAEGHHSGALVHWRGGRHGRQR